MRNGAAGLLPPSQSRLGGTALSQLVAHIIG